MADEFERFRVKVQPGNATWAPRGGGQLRTFPRETIEVAVPVDPRSDEDG